MRGGENAVFANFAHQKKNEGRGEKKKKKKKANH